MVSEPPSPSPPTAGKKYAIWTYLMQDGTNLAPNHRHSFVRQLIRKVSPPLYMGRGTKDDTKTGGTLFALDVRP